VALLIFVCSGFRLGICAAGAEFDQFAGSKLVPPKAGPEGVSPGDGTNNLAGLFSHVFARNALEFD